MAVQQLKYPPHIRFVWAGSAFPQSSNSCPVEVARVCEGRDVSTPLGLILVFKVRTDDLGQVYGERMSSDSEVFKGAVCTALNETHIDICHLQIDYDNARARERAQAEYMRDTSQRTKTEVAL